MTLPHGLYGFPITPSDEGGRVDTVAMRKLVTRLVEAKVNGIGLLGSTGTYMYLNREQRLRTLEAAVDEVKGRMPIIVGVGALRTDDAISYAQDAKAAGAAAGLLAPVSYTPLTAEEVVAHFSMVSRKSGLPLIIYDNPGTTHFSFTPELIRRLAQIPGVFAIKNPSGNRDQTIAHLSAQRQSLPRNFSIGYSGDANSTEAMIAGADVWYSVLGGILPKPCIDIVAAAQRGDAAEARRLQNLLSPVWDLFTAHSSLRVVYALTELLGICSVVPPRPLLPLSEPVKNTLRQVLEDSRIAGI